MAETPKKRKKITIRELQRKMREKEQIVQLAVYDYRNAVIADRLGVDICLLYTSPSPRDRTRSRMPSSA